MATTPMFNLLTILATLLLAATGLHSIPRALGASSTWLTEARVAVPKALRSMSASARLTAGLVAELTEQRGLDIKLYVETAPGTFTLVGALRNVDFSINGESIDASHAGSGAWRKKLSGLKDWEASAGTVLLMDLDTGGFDAALGYLKTTLQGPDQVGGNTIGVQLEWPDGSTDTGEAIITEFSISGSYDGVAEGSVSLEGSGALVYAEAA
jgi:predicted secreted protein